jgi:hypothetical protein
MLRSLMLLEPQDLVHTPLIRLELTNTTRLHKRCKSAGHVIVVVRKHQAFDAPRRSLNEPVVVREVPQTDVKQLRQKVKINDLVVRPELRFDRPHSRHYTPPISL